MQELENKYINLLLEMCLDFNKSKSLFISYNKINKSFVKNIVEKAKLLGAIDIKLNEEDLDLTREKLLNLTEEELKNDPYFDNAIWNEYAEKGSNFLMLATEIPGIMEDVDPKKLQLVKEICRNSREIFTKKEINYEIPWCIAAVPNKIWADNIFGESDDSYEKLYKTICKMCLVDTNDPVANWKSYIEEMYVLSEKLNNLEIKTLHYKNGLGTDLKLEMPKDCMWNSIASEQAKGMFVNMPSYEIFSTPNYKTANGIVYSSKPLVYGGRLIDKFYLKFKDGKVVEYDALVGKDVLKGIIEGDENSCYLGEVALVNYDSPISNTNLVFGTTLFDENASCHLALGSGFPDSVIDGNKLNKQELLERGVNISKVHVDFMIGTKDLNITAETKNGEVNIFKDGNFCI